MFHGVDAWSFALALVSCLGIVGALGLGIYVLVQILKDFTND